MNIYLRPLTEVDYPLTMAWRSNPLVYEGFYTQTEPLKWDEHTNWIKSRNQDWRNFIIMYNDRPVGAVTISQLDHWSPEIGVYVGETTLWGKCVGYNTILLAIKWLQQYAKEHKQIVEIHTTIKDSNERSRKLFKKCGFEWMARGRQGESWHNRALEDRDATIRCIVS